MEHKVYVIAADGRPLMPTTRFGKVRRMLRDGKASVVQRKPFTIRLAYEPETREVQNLYLSVDAGRSNIGMVVVKEDGGIVYAARVETRNKDVARNMQERRMQRTARRGRRREKKKRRARANGTAYAGVREIINPGAEKPVFVDTCKGKPARYLNRRRPEGWVTPTVRHCIETHLHAVGKVTEILPIQKIIVEAVVMDFHKLSNPAVQGVGYQQGPMKGYKSLREKIFHIQDGKCLFCERSIEEIHHIRSRGRNGADSEKNSAGLCREHHRLVQNDRKWAAALYAIKKGHAKQYADGSIINAATPYILRELRAAYGESAVIETQGYETADTRERYGVAKAHPADAWCAAVGVLHLNPRRIPKDFRGYVYSQYRRHNRAAVSYLHERSYKDATGKVVGKNRNKRADQKYDSLAEYRASFPDLQEAERAISNLRVTPGGIFLRSRAGYSPGTWVKAGGEAKQVRKTTTLGKCVYFIGEEKSTSSKQCTLLYRPGGLVCC